MQLTSDEKAMLNGERGKAKQKAMQILVTLGEIYGAERLVPVSSVQISGVSYSNLGEPGLKFLQDLAKDGKVEVLTTLNPAGMDLEEWHKLGISDEFAKNQLRVIEAFEAMGVVSTATCTPYLVGNVPHYGEHIAWAESSAVCFANSVIGARTNREGGPSALAAALTGKTPLYGYHLDENRKPVITVRYTGELHGEHEFGALARIIGNRIKNKIPYITGITEASLEELKSFSASIATYGGTAMFHMESITPETNKYRSPETEIHLTREDVLKEVNSCNDPIDFEIDFVSIGCPHASLKEIETIARMVEGKKVTKEFWITTSRPIKLIADRIGYTKIIEETGAKIAADTCCVVSPIKGRFKALATNSAKGCYYGAARNNFKIKYMSLEECVMEALK